MFKKIFPLALLALAFQGAKAADVKTVRHAGPFVMSAPLRLDSVDVNGKKAADYKLIDNNVDVSRVWSGDAVDVDAYKRDTVEAIHLLGFTVSSTSYSRMKVTVEGLTNMQLYVDGVRQNDINRIEMLPQTHQLVVKYVPAKADTAALKLSVESLDSVEFTLGDGTEKRLPSIDDMFTGWYFGESSLSADGKWAVVYKYSTQPGGNVLRKHEIRELTTGRVSERRYANWMPSSSEYYYTRQETDKGITLVAVNPATQKERIVATRLPKESFTIAPTEDYLILSDEARGPEERKDIYEVLNPEDRQPGWRNRNTLSIYNIKTGITQPLTFGHHSAWVSDISRDGKKLLVTLYDNDFTRRPSSMQTVLLVTLPEQQGGEIKTDTLVWKDGFLASSSFSPDGNMVAFRGSPETFNRIGCTLPADKTPNMYEYELYVMDLKGEALRDTSLTYRRPVRSLSRDFDPSVEEIKWGTDGMIYANVTDKDCKRLVQINPKSGNIRPINVPEDVIRAFDVAYSAPVMTCYGESAMNGSRLYSVDLRSLKVTLREDLSPQRIDNWKVAPFESWTYDNGRGDKINCGFCVPADFDPAKKYPMIVHYYGGCSPTLRYFTGAYSPQLYAAHGYVALIVNPSGASGFGQEFASRHVKTAGDGVSQDIIGAAQEFCRQHPFVDDKKVGCISASYGGFMTQYMLSETDFFATGVSHAGISSHAGYWGEGYWGYSYSEVSMGDAYPWNAKDLYVDQSPLFRADRIHKPLLLTHGTKDTNVPPSESIQMFTALKRCGVETALLMIDGENHHILTYDKRNRWINSIMAWFDRWLKDEPAWWQSVYKDKEL